MLSHEFDSEFDVSLMYLWCILFHVFSWHFTFVSRILNQHAKLGEFPRQRLETVLWWMTWEKTFLTCWRNTESKTFRWAKIDLSRHSTIFKHLQTISNLCKHVSKLRTSLWTPPPYIHKDPRTLRPRREHLSAGWYSGGCDIHSSFFWTGSTKLYFHIAVKNYWFLGFPSFSL